MLVIFFCDYQRGVLALRMKPIIEKRAEEKMLSGANQYSSPSQKSDEAPPIRADEAVSTLANVSRDTIRKSGPRPRDGLKN